ncbi:MATE efflux family protein 1 [Acorus gramineus]|uniref:Protein DETOXIFICATION n=1 Tax=Acorus gramineus TaxID=55184 RepID=A0AAV9A523_ACOGR|nr:MATE efflux family protein 1 [Acorus gramineus]
MDELGSEIARIAIPAALAFAADPVASLVDTAFVGHIGPVELAAVGVSIAVFNQVSKVAIYPLVSVTTSFVAEEDAACKSIEPGETEDVEKAHPVNSETKEATPCSGCKLICFLFCNWSVDSDSTRCNPSFCSGRASKRKHIPSVTSALIVGGVLGVLQAILLIFEAKPILHIMGVKSGSPMLKPACQYLTLRALSSPAVLLSLAMQGVFRGFKDTKTPLYATGAADASNIALDAILIFVFHWGVSGAAIAHAISQYLMAVILLLRLIKKVDILPPSIRDLKFSRFLKCGFLLLGRVIAVTFCVTLAASMAAHQGSIPMAAFQICLQFWLATSLVADGLAVAGQAIIASSFAKGDHPKVVATASRVLQLSVVLGLVLTCLLGVGMQFGSTVFTKDANVIKMIHMALPFVAATQPINSVAFVFDGINFGASDYAYSAYSMIVVAGLSIMSLFLLSSSNGFIGIWIALTIYISLRMFAGIWRLGAARGPWSFLHLYPICS